MLMSCSASAFLFSPLHFPGLLYMLVAALLEPGVFAKSLGSVMYDDDLQWLNQVCSLRGIQDKCSCG